MRSVNHLDDLLLSRGVELNKWYQVGGTSVVKFVNIKYLSQEYEVLFRDVGKVRQIPEYAIRGIKFTPRPDLDKEDLVQTDLKDLLK